MNFKLQRTAAKADSTCVAMYVLSEPAALEMFERDIFPWALRIGQESPSAGSFRSLPFFARIKFLLRSPVKKLGRSGERVAQKRYLHLCINALRNKERERENLKEIFLFKNPSGDGGQSARVDMQLRFPHALITRLAYISPYGGNSSVFHAYFFSFFASIKLHFMASDKFKFGKKEAA